VQQLEEAGLTIAEAIVCDPQDDTIQQTVDRLGGARVEPVPIPHDCLDGFFHAWLHSTTRPARTAANGLR